MAGNLDLLTQALDGRFRRLCQAPSIINSKLSTFVESAEVPYGVKPRSRTKYHAAGPHTLQCVDTSGPLPTRAVSIKIPNFS